MPPSRQLDWNPETRTWTLDDYTVAVNRWGAFDVLVPNSEGKPETMSRDHSSLSAAEAWIRKQRRVNRRTTKITLLGLDGEEHTFTGYHAGSGQPIIDGQHGYHVNFRSSDGLYANTEVVKEAIRAYQLAQEQVALAQEELAHFRVPLKRISSKDQGDIEALNEAVEATEEAYELAKRGETPKDRYDY